MPCPLNSKLHHPNRSFRPQISPPCSAMRSPTNQPLQPGAQRPEWSLQLPPEPGIGLNSHCTGSVHGIIPGHMAWPLIGG